MLAPQRPVGQRRLDRRHDLQRFRHAPRPEFAASHVALIGSDRQHALPGQSRQIARRRRVGPHPHIHCRRDQNPRVGGQQKGRGQIVRAALRHLCHQVRRRRCHHDQVRHPRQLDMAHLGLIRQIEQISVNLGPGKRSDRQRRHKLGPGARQNRRHRCAALFQPADQVKRLVGGDAAADDQKNTLARQHVSAFDLGSRLWCRGHARGTQPPCGGSAVKAAQGSSRGAGGVTIQRS